MNVELLEGLVERDGRNVGVLLLALVLDHDDALRLPSSHEGVPHESSIAHGLLELVLGVNLQQLLESVTAALHIYADVQVDLEADQRALELLHRLLEVGLRELHPLQGLLASHLLLHDLLLDLLRGEALHLHSLHLLGSRLSGRGGIRVLNHGLSEEHDVGSLHALSLEEHLLQAGGLRTRVDLENHHFARVVDRVGVLLVVRLGLVVLFVLFNTAVIDGGLRSFLALFITSGLNLGATLSPFTSRLGLFALLFLLLVAGFFGLSLFSLVLALLLLGVVASVESWLGKFRSGGIFLVTVLELDTAEVLLHHAETNVIYLLGSAD